jgi:hypothetical protein
MWIKCSDQLPEKSGEYLITKELYKNFRIVYISIFHNNKWDDFNVIAWQELPEPYNE